MAAKMLEEVLEKEKQTAQNEADANDKADEIVANAKAEAEKIIKDATDNSVKLEKEQIAQANSRSEKAVKDASDEAEKYAEMLKSKADTKFSEAVGIIREIIVG